MMFFRNSNFVCQAAGRRRVIENFSLDAFTDKLVGHIRTAIDEKAPPRTEDKKEKKEQ